MASITTLTLNIHKGFSSSRRFILPQLREALRAAQADIVFLQEVLGRHERHASRILDWPDQSQAEFLADEVWSDFSYGRNAIYDEGDHGNAILSRWILESCKNRDISSSRLEQRGFLTGQILIERKPLHLVCLHLSLLSRDRRRQYEAISQFISSEIPADQPLIVAGDFNDWKREAQNSFASPLGLTEAYRHLYGKESRTFPSFYPLFPVDRVYSRGFSVKKADRLHGDPWSKLSDHLPLRVEFEWT